MSPFLDKSLPELLAMVPGLADPELNALCAAVCDENWVRYSWTRPYSFSATRWEQWRLYLYGRQPQPYWQSVNANKYTSDGREAMRLLEKYRLELGPNGYCGKPEVFWECAPCLEDVRGLSEPSVWATNPCRAITEAVVAAELTKMIGEE